MKTPTRILVGGPEVTSAFVLSALVHARARHEKRYIKSDLNGLTTYFSTGQLAVDEWSHPIALPEERRRARDHQVTFGEPFADLDLALGQQAD